ncbi:MAG: Choline-sulfatase [Verrucomicrobiota bacterium]|jgi:arylsulfatase A-like enzyme
MFTLARALAFALSLLSPLTALRAAAPAAPPNILFIAFDDLRDWLGYLGHAQAQTPNFDRLAQRGTSFTRSYAISTVCNPSRASTLLGLRPGATGIYGNTTDWRDVARDLVTLPQHFKAHGYTVLGTGKISHDAWQRPADWTDYFQAPTVGNWQEHLVARGGKLPPAAFAVGRNVVTPLDVPDADLSDHANTSWAIAQLQRHHTQPLFLALGIRKPHPLFEVPRKYFDLYPLEKIQLPKVNDHDRDDLPKGGLRMAGPTEEHDDIVKADKWRELVQAYLACISFADAQLGRMLDALDASPLRDNTIVVLWSDHGWHLGEKQHWHKFTLWEESARAPLLWVAPGLTRPGSVCARTVDFTHIYPTLCDLAGLPRPAHIEGLSIRPLLADPAATWTTPAVTTYKFGNHAVRSERWRYIRYEDGGEELYDHDADPLEWKNLAGDAQFAAIKTEHARWLPTLNRPAVETAPAAKEGKKKKADK